jgi:Dickkopf N-terminal cysteine-rich region
MRRLASVALSLVTLASCSSSPATHAADASAPMTLGAFCDAFMAANAAILSRCLGGDESLWASGIPAQYSCSALSAAVTAGRVLYDPTQAPACIGAYPELSCTDLLVGPTECDGPLAGTAKDGAACFGDGDCGGASYCGGIGHGQSACSGFCTPLLAAGATCTATQECAIGYTCGGAPMLTCISDRHPLADEGKSCAPVMPTMPSIECAPGLSCSHATLTCAKTVEQGGACVPGEALCETFTYCDGASKTCKPYAGAGGTCGAATGGETMGCLPGFYCAMESPMSPTGACTALGKSGAPCTEGFECASASCGTPTNKGVCSTPCTEE